MVRHILLFSFRDGVNPAARAELLAELRRLPRLFAQIRDFELGGNQSRRDQTYEYGMTMTFATIEHLTSYLDSAVHEELVTHRFRPLIENRSIVSFKTGR